MPEAGLEVEHDLLIPRDSREGDKIVVRSTSSSTRSRLRLTKRKVWAVVMPIVVMFAVVFMLGLGTGVMSVTLYL